MKEIDVGEKKYRIGRLDTFKQLHVGRRLAPLIAGLQGVAPPRADAADGDVALGQFLTSAFGRLSGVLAEMPDKEIDYILNACLKVCVRSDDGKAWHPVMHSNGTLMFQDIQLQQLLELTWAVIEENLGGFFAAPAGDTAPIPAAGSVQA